MRCFVLTCVVLISLLACGCMGGDPVPERDPNFKPTDNPSNIDTSQMQKMRGPGAPGGAAPAKP
ncbi:MAG: hypothetical protein KJZ78_29570 [Bryobacteraceae bacterium]|nr:hypothetical protein [Bryobacteraceae bacterium]